MKRGKGKLRKWKKDHAAGNAASWHIVNALRGVPRRMKKVEAPPKRVKGFL